MLSAERLGSHIRQKAAEEAADVWSESGEPRGARFTGSSSQEEAVVSLHCSTASVEERGEKRSPYGTPSPVANQAPPCGGGANRQRRSRG